VLERRDDPGRPGLLPLVLALRLLPASDASHEGESRPVRRPDGIADAVREIGEAPGLAAVRAHHIELRLLVGVTLGDERESYAVRRPPGRGVALRPRRESSRLTAGDVDHPDVRQVFVTFLGELRDHEGDARTVRRDLRIAHEADAREVTRLHRTAAGHRAFGRGRTRGARRAPTVTCGRPGLASAARHPAR